jgi:dTDP-4-amino-4,6-dideoxygalactose transaminase
MIPVANAMLGEEEAKAVYDVVRSGWISKGRKVDEFEEAFKKKVHAKHAIAINSCTSALHVALLALGIGKGDEVIVPSLTFISSANAILYVNAVPVLAECDPRTYNVSVDEIKKRITKKTKAIIAVDMNGMPVDYDAIQKLGEENGIPVISDSAESLGASYKNRMIGSIANIHVFSFFPNKTITVGEGGMITTGDDRLAAKMRILLNQGQDSRYHHVELGYNYRMVDIQAAIGIEQLKKMDYIIKEKSRIAAVYDKVFADTKNIQPPFVPDYVTQHAWYLYVVSVAGARDEIVKELKEQGIETRLSFPPIHTQPYYQKTFGYTNSSLPITYKAWSQLINIPLWAGMDTKTQKFVIDTLKKICGHR